MYKADIEVENATKYSNTAQSNGVGSIEELQQMKLAQLMDHLGMSLAHAKRVYVLLHPSGGETNSVSAVFEARATLVYRLIRSTFCDFLLMCLSDFRNHYDSGPPVTYDTCTRAS